MGDLLLVRHGETEWTVNRRHTSITDVPLTARGEQQAMRLAMPLRTLDIARVLTSPRTRATHTAQLAGLPNPQICDDLCEWDYGAYEGLRTADILRRRPEWSLWRDGVPPGNDQPGEGPEDVGARADRVLASLHSDLDAAGRLVVVVGHGHFLRVLAARRLGLPPAAGSLFRLDTATVSRLSVEHGRPVVAQWNQSYGESTEAGRGETDRRPDTKVPRPRVGTDRG
ncbi:putative phosphoglycerate mutase [Kitasatospora herbaricolor]|uniref:histidine phosphatase family protein n=1 Tax=Kitasatospora herbaricolor TaxID=68217 RepID=UPI00174CBF1E|nr:histidine phosphatase family protein [Kitasatospora herbaricolor]MDQ0312617.1 putative phosphoglycerate mutase [Kitasatospora herbaricolor]